LLDRHLVRLYSAATTIELSGLPPAAVLEQQVLETLARATLADAYVRVTVTRGAGGVGLAAAAGAPTVVVAVLPAPARKPAEEGIELTPLEWRGEERPAAKSTSWQQAVLDRRRVERLGADEGLYVSTSGRVLEGVSSNVFAVEGALLLTPPVRECFPGITRGRILELAAAAGLQVREAAIGLDELRDAKEVFVTNAVQGLRFVRAISGAPIAARTVPGVFAELRRRYEEDRGALVTPVASASG
jgi:branched-subunit amino acid aminotransferase/4-amino-4-deoxychorismate lyase